MGATVAFELARLLRNRFNREPAILFISARRAPDFPRESEDYHKLPDREFISTLRSFNGTPDALLDSEDAMASLLPIIRADFKAVETYIYREDLPLNCPIRAYGGISDETTSAAELHAWHVHTRGSFELKLIPGDHFFIYGGKLMLLEQLRYELNIIGRQIERRHLVAGWPKQRK
jgi:medium-chain acyl-[acyl-carrier-protein] hydrolase